MVILDDLYVELGTYTYKVDTIDYRVILGFPILRWEMISMAEASLSSTNHFPRSIGKLRITV